VIGSGAGIGEGALELFRYVRITTSFDVLWLARHEADLAAAEAFGIPAVLATSRAGFLATLRAGVIVVTHGFGDANRFANRGAFIVQLWHGIPLKLIQLDSPVTTRIGIPGERYLRGMLRRAYRRGYRSIGLLPAASDAVAVRLRSAFGLTESQLAVTGDPRDDVLSRGNESDRVERARLLLAERVAFSSLEFDLVPFPRIILYAPTWREGDPDPGAPSPEQWRSIDRYLEESGSLLILRPHPHGVGDYDFGLGSRRVVLLTSADLADVTPILSAIDVLVTDFSSIAFDYSLTGGPTLFLAADEDSYTETRGLYEPYREFSAGRAVRSWDGILAQLARLDSDAAWADQVREDSRTLCARHFAFTDGRNTERVFAEIIARRSAP
jgi:CDP-glycerol glycerophosphotransferase